MIEVKYTGPHGWGQKAYPGDAGIDLPIIQDHVFMPGEFADLPSGIKVAIPEGYYGRIVARSSALRKKRIRVYEGIIDAGFRGELFTYMECVGPGAQEVKAGDRLAQLIITPVLDVTFTNGQELPESVRGEQGFGSSDRRPTTKEDVITRAAFPPRVRSLYLGGPIDHATGECWWEQSLQRDAIARVLPDHWIAFDPKARNNGEPDPTVIWNRNMKALFDADVAMFCFMEGPGCYGFGSPIEIAERVMAPVDGAILPGQFAGIERRPTIVYVQGHSPGVYLRKLWQDHNLILTDDWGDAKRLLAEEIAKVG